MKRKLFSLAILVMVLSLAFIGCSSSSDDDDGPPPNEETFTNVTTSYPREIVTDLSSSSLTIASAQKSDTSGIVYITLGGEVETDFQYITTIGSTPTGEWDNLWGDPAVASFNPLAGKYGTFVFKPFTSITDVNTLNIAIKQTNDALRYYTDLASLEAAPLTVPFEGSGPGGVYIPSSSDTATRWKKYDPYTTASIFEVLLWSGAANKTITLEIQSFIGSPADPAVEGTDYTVLGTIVIDYSDVDFD
jgi:hypothetical protein